MRTRFRYDPATMSGGGSAVRGAGPHPFAADPGAPYEKHSRPGFPGLMTRFQPGPAATILHGPSSFDSCTAAREASRAWEAGGGAPRHGVVASRAVAAATAAAATTARRLCRCLRRASQITAGESTASMKVLFIVAPTRSTRYEADWPPS